MVSIVAELVELAGLFGRIATADPISAILLLIGMALVGGASLVVAYLVAGAAVDLISPAPR